VSAVRGILWITRRPGAALVDRSLRMDDDSEPTAGTAVPHALTHGQMARALRLASVGAADPKAAVTHMPGMRGGLEDWTVPVEPTPAARRPRVGASITAAMLVVTVLGTSVASKKQVASPDSGQMDASGPAQGGSIPGRGAAPRDRGARGAATAIATTDSPSQEPSKMLSKLTGVTVAAAVGVSASIAGAQAPAVQWKVEDGGNGHWYRVIQASSFNDAMASASAQGAHLATATSAEENAKITALLGTTSASRAHIGLMQPDNQTAVNVGWQWVTGEPISFTQWRCFGGSIGCAPDDTPCGTRPYRVEDNQANCGALERNGDWDDLEKGAWCDGGTRVAIIEWSADCNNDGIVDYGQIMDGSLADDDGDGIPDCCESDGPCEFQVDSVEWSAAAGGNGHWYGVLRADGPLTWNDARTRARRLGGDLVAFADIQERDFAFAVAAQVPDAFDSHPVTASRWGPWVGALIGTAGWQWTDGTGMPLTGENRVTINSASSCCGAEEDRLFIYTNMPVPAPSNLELNDLPASGVCNSGACPIGIAIRSALVEWSADCNNDGIVDHGQILVGQLSDVNTNGTPDACECLGDVNDDGWIDGLDLGIVLASWSSQKAGDPADLNGDGAVDGVDLGVLLAGWGACPN
jgi:hypothetical protein